MVIFIELQVFNIICPGGGQVPYLSPQWAPMLLHVEHYS